MSRVSLCLALLSICGCRLFDRGKIAGTMGYRQQMEEITRIAPYGTPREKAIAALEQAGITGEYSRAGKSIYYCHLWDRSDGKRWHMTVSLLFNTQDEFYAVNLADADIKQGDAPGASAGTKPPRSSSGTAAPIPWPQEKERSGPALPDPAGTDRRAGRRTPFEDESR